MAEQMQQEKKQPIKEQQITQTATGQTQPTGEKKPKWWIWLIIALVVIGIGVGIYFWLF